MIIQRTTELPAGGFRHFRTEYSREPDCIDAIPSGGRG
jgi:hypothetical protein